LLTLAKTASTYTVIFSAFNGHASHRDGNSKYFVDATPTTTTNQPEGTLFELPHSNILAPVAVAVPVENYLQLHKRLPIHLLIDP
jgi:hypothetical protein